jgi:hypothetical protein
LTLVFFGGFSSKGFAPSIALPSSWLGAITHHTT